MRGSDKHREIEMSKGGRGPLISGASPPPTTTTTTLLAQDCN